MTKAVSHTVIGVAPLGEPTGNGKAHGFSETQIAAIVREGEAGKKARETRRQYGRQ